MNASVNTLVRESDPPVSFDLPASLTREPVMKGYRYWQAARGERDMPARKDMSPQGMRDFVSHVGLVEVRRDEDGRYDFFIRLAGAKIENVFGSITGKALGQFLPADVEARWRSVFEVALQAKVPVSTTSRVVFGGKGYLVSETLIAPLGDGGEVTLLFAAIDTWPAV